MKNKQSVTTITKLERFYTPAAQASMIAMERMQ